MVVSMDTSKMRVVLGRSSDPWFGALFVLGINVAEWIPLWGRERTKRGRLRPGAFQVHQAAAALGRRPGWVGGGCREGFPWVWVPPKRIQAKLPKPPIFPAVGSHALGIFEQNGEARLN